MFIEISKYFGRLKENIFPMPLAIFKARKR